MDLLLFNIPRIGDLEPGKVYVWQIRKDLVTTSGTEEILSDILHLR